MIDEGAGQRLASLATIQADIGAARKAMVTATWAAVVVLVIGGLFLGIGVGFWLGRPLTRLHRFLS
jgi:hypothetical protein